MGRGATHHVVGLDTAPDKLHADLDVLLDRLGVGTEAWRRGVRVELHLGVDELGSAWPSTAKFVTVRRMEWRIR